MWLSRAGDYSDPRFWVGGFVLFHIAAFALHILLIDMAAVALVIHLIRGGRRAA